LPTARVDITRSLASPLGRVAAMSVFQIEDSVSWVEEVEIAVETVNECAAAFSEHAPLR
jgi:hypothetical protein